MFLGLGSSSYIAAYRCCNCKHEFECRQGLRNGSSNAPHYGCPQCSHAYVLWLNYAELARTRGWDLWPDGLPPRVKPAIRQNV